MSNNTEQTDVNPSTKQDGATQSDTPQVKRDEKGRILPGTQLNPDGKGGFKDNPDHRSNGSWKKEETPRAKLEKLLSDVKLGEFLEQVKNTNNDANVDETLGDVLLSGRLANAIVQDPDSNGKITVNSKELDSLLYFVYGSKSETDNTLRGEGEGFAMIKGFILPTAPEDFIDKDIREQLPEQQRKDQ